MSKPRIIRITYGEEMPEKSAQLFSRILEKVIINHLPDDPELKGIFLQDSPKYKQIQNEENDL